MIQWKRTSYQDPKAQALADRHYSREGKEGKGFGRPGFALILYAVDPEGGEVLFVWWRPKWESDLPQAQRFDGLKAIECTLFRNESRWKSSELVASAASELLTWEHARDVKLTDGLVTCVNSQKTAARRSTKSLPGQCFRIVGWTEFNHPPSRNADVWLQLQLKQDENLSRWLEDRAALGWASMKGITDSTKALFRQMPGRKFFALAVLRYHSLRPRTDGKGGIPIWECECACGNTVTRRQDDLLNGATTSCSQCPSSRLTNLTSNTLRYLALAIELEGSIGCYKISPVVAIGVRDYSKCLLEMLQKETLLGRISSAGPQKVQWRVTGGEAIGLCKQLMPFLVTKRRQAEAVVSFPLGARNERVSPEKRVERNRLWDLTRQLNKRGPRPPAPEWQENAVQWRLDIAAMLPTERARLLSMAIEFEGNLGVHEHQHEPSRNGVRHDTTVGVPQAVQRTVLLELIQLLSGGLGYITAPDKPKDPKHSPMRHWVVESIEHTKRLAKQMLPHLMGKRPIAELILQFPEWPHRPFPVPDADFATRRKLAIESKRLNEELKTEDINNERSSDEKGKIVEAPVGESGQSERVEGDRQQLPRM